MKTIDPAAILLRSGRVRGRGPARAVRVLGSFRNRKNAKVIEASSADEAAEPLRRRYRSAVHVEPIDPVLLRPGRTVPDLIPTGMYEMSVRGAGPTHTYGHITAGVERYEATSGPDCVIGNRPDAVRFSAVNIGIRSWRPEQILREDPNGMS